MSDTPWDPSRPSQRQDETRRVKDVRVYDVVALAPQEADESRDERGSEAE